MQLPNELSGRSPLNFSLKKNSYFLKKCLRNFQETEFLIFQERNIQNPCITELLLYFRKGIFRTLAFRIFSYTSGKRCSEPWHNRTFLVLQERNIQNLGITEFSSISRNGAFYTYIFLIFQETAFRVQNNKKLCPEKKSYISGMEFPCPKKT